MQLPHPPVWIAASGDRAVARAARLGDAWLINPHTTLDTLRKQVGLYRDALSGAGRPLPADRPIFRECYVAPDYETAVAAAGPYIEGKYQSYASWGLDRPMAANESLRGSFRDLEAWVADVRVVEVEAAASVENGVLRHFGVATEPS